MASPMVCTAWDSATNVAAITTTSLILSLLIDFWNMAMMAMKPMSEAPALAMVEISRSW